MNSDKNKFIILAYLLFFICSCSQNDSFPLQTLEIYGRSDPTTHSSKELIYRMQVPIDWNVQFPSSDASLIDTKEPLLTLTKSDVIVTFHNFPTSDLSHRIPVMAQATRWKNQFSEIDESHLHLLPFAVSGFIGIQFDGTGIQKGSPVRVLAWALQLTPELFQKLPNNAFQQKADLTLKAVGPPENLAALETELILIASSIELIQEISFR